MVLTMLWRGKSLSSELTFHTVSLSSIDQGSALISHIAPDSLHTLPQSWLSSLRPTLIFYQQLVVSIVSKCKVDVDVHIGARFTFRSIINELDDLYKGSWLQSGTLPGREI